MTSSWLPCRLARWLTTAVACAHNAYDETDDCFAHFLYESCNEQKTCASTKMAGSIACQFCSELMDRFRCLSENSGFTGSRSATLGILSDIIEMRCPHADSIRKMWDQEEGLRSYFGRMDEAIEKGLIVPRHWTIDVYEGDNMTLQLVFAGPETFEFMMRSRLILRPDKPGHAGTTTFLHPRWIDPPIIHTWYDRCVEDHGQKCGHPDWMTLRPEPIVMPEWLVDVDDYCVVECNSDTARYIALSYTWGRVQCLKHTSQTLERLKRRGSLQPDQASDIPQTVRDAFEITKLLGERYLWVDSLCIPQGEETANKGLHSMHHIYANSMICLIAFAGTDANHGLRGIHGTSAPRYIEQSIYAIADGERVSWIPDSWRNMSEDIEYMREPGRRYNERGWTYQEYVFAKRRLLFTDGLLRWTCQCTNWSEEVDRDFNMVGLPTALPGSTSWMTRPGPTLDLITDAACDFNARYFTYERDTLKAFLGIQNHISRDFLGGLNYGHPEIFFDISLLWRAESMSPEWRGITKRRGRGSPKSDPPSWSWMGWQGEFSFDRDEEYKMWAKSEVGFTRSVAQWYKTQNPVAYASDMQPVNCQWHIHRAAVKSGSAHVPFGWQKFTHDRCGSRHCYLRVVADEFANNNEDDIDDLQMARTFKYPIPLPLCTETCRSTEQCPFIFARTSRAFFTAKKMARSNPMPGWEMRTKMYPYGLFCQDGECAGLLRLHGVLADPPFQVEVVAVVAGWTGILSECFYSFYERQSPESPEWSDKDDSLHRRHNCYFVLCIQWESGVAKRLGTGMVEADIWERNQEPVDLILG